MAKGGAIIKSTYTQKKYKKDGTVKKARAISEKKFDRKSKRYLNQRGVKSLGNNTSKTQTVVSKNRRKSVTKTTDTRIPSVKKARKMTMAAKAGRAAAAAAKKAAAKKAAAKKKPSRYTYAKF